MDSKLQAKLDSLLASGKFETKEVSLHGARKSMPAKAAIKSVEGRRVTGIAAVYGNVDSGLDRIHMGAFKKSISEGQGRQKHFWAHDIRNPPIALIAELKEVGKSDLPPAVLEYAPEATGGLQVTREYLSVPLADWVLENVTKGAMEMSIGYDPLNFEFTVEGEGDGQRKIRELKELRLWETSDVNFGMNAATVADSGKGLPLETLALALEALNQELKSGRRNAAADLKLINAIHSASVALGSDECKGVATAEDTGKSRAGEVPLTLLRSRLQVLEMSLLT